MKLKWTCFQKKIIYLIIILFNIPSSSICMNKTFFAIQISLSKNNNYISKKYNQLKKNGIPLFIEERNSPNGKLYILASGFFSNRSDVKNFRRYYFKRTHKIIEYKDITRYKQKIIDNVKIDTIPSSCFNKTSYIYFGSKNPIIILYYYKYGTQATRMPSDLYIYSRNKKRVLIKNITGFRELVDKIRIGKSIEVASVGTKVSLKKNIKNISVKYKIPVNVIEKNLTSFLDGYQKRITILHEYNLKTNEMIFKPQVGFDYLSSRNKEVIVKGDIPDFISKSMGTLFGNYHLIKTELNKKYFFKKNDKIILFIKRINNDQRKLKLCLLFFK